MWQRVRPILPHTNAISQVVPLAKAFRLPKSDATTHRTPKHFRAKSMAASYGLGFRIAAYGRGCGVGRGRGVGVDLGVALGVPVGVAVGVCVAVAVAVGVAVGVCVAVAVAVAVGVAVGVGVGVPPPDGDTRT